MITLIHKGKRPSGKLEESDRVGYQFMERLPLGGVKYWLGRELISGCGGSIEVVWINELMYCPHCDEWFNYGEFERVSE